MDLSKSGWRIHPDWLEKSPAKSAKELLKSALDTDIKDLKSEEQILSRLLESAQKEKIFKCPSGGGIVLQINKIRNVSAPKINEDSSVAPRMIKLTLSDGHNSVQAVEMQPKIDKLNTSTAPGNKIRLKTDAEIPFVGGFLQLRNEHCEILGGRVETLAEKFEVQKKLQKFTRATDSHAPPWIPFGKKIVAANVDAKQVSKTLKVNLPILLLQAFKRRLSVQSSQRFVFAEFFSHAKNDHQPHSVLQGVLPLGLSTYGFNGKCTYFATYSNRSVNCVTLQ